MECGVWSMVTDEFQRRNRVQQIALSPDALVERLFAAALGMFDIATIYMGDQLGLYDVLAKRGSFTPAALAEAAGTNERYTREWLEQQGATGILICENPDANPGERCYELPEAYRDIFVNPDSLSAMTPMAQIMVGSIFPMQKVLNAFRNGGGVGYDEFGADLAEGQARSTRPTFRNQLVQEWMPAMPDIVARFESTKPARVADVGMGYGWSSVSLAHAYPNILVEGFDLDAASVESANKLAADEGVADRVTFHCRKAEASNEPYDLAMAVECIHDMSDPVSVLADMRRMVAPDGAVLVVDERAPDAYSAPGDDLDRYFYGFSVLHCLPAGMADGPSEETGTVIREATMRDFATRAGFSNVEVLPVEHDFFRLYRMTP
jgi:2-polyprenyl-3-methyl-5-hydroxy-6-metoxy-1,4-benzoquinol methylase